MPPRDPEYPSLRTHLLGMLAVSAALFFGMTLYVYSASRSLFFETLRKELSGDLQWIASILGNHPDWLRETQAGAAALDSMCRAVSRYKGFRVTLADGYGKVIADSHVPLQDVAGLQNHRDRPEFAAARRDGWGYAWRYSGTLDMDMLYVAHRLPAGTHFLRLAAGHGALNAFHRTARHVFVLFLALFLASSLAVIWWISRKISSPLLRLAGDGEPSMGENLPNHPAPPRWDAKFREASLLNLAFRAYSEKVRILAGKVEKERDRLEAVLNRLEEGILILSASGRVQAANPSAFLLLGNQPPASDGSNSWAGKTLGECIADEALVRWTAEAANPNRLPVLQVDKGPAAPFDLLCHLTPLDLEGSGREYVLTLLNITEFKHLDRIKSEFVANASHELKTPLSSIKGFSEALLEGAMHNEKLRESFIGKIHSNALRLEKLVQDLLSLSRLEADPVPRASEPLPLRGYVNAAANLHRRELDESGIRFENHVPEDIRALLEPRDLELILNNLIGNAVKYNRPGGKIKVGLEEGEGLRLYVKDTGAGIPAEMLPRIFERFYRADASRARQDGTGLGLAIVKHAAQKYGMAVKAESVPGDGSRFTVEIPAALVRRAWETPELP